MLMSPSAAMERFFGTVETYPELAGKRVLITGISAVHGIDIASAFAERGARIVLHIASPSTETDALGEVLAPLAAEIVLFDDPLESAEAIVTLARRAIMAFGGIDAVIVLVPLVMQTAATDLAAVEAEISRVLLAPCLIARIAANRMKLFGNGGTILHVASLPRGASDTEMAFAAAAKATLATMTRADASAWAKDGIRVVAVAPETGMASGHGLAGEPDVASLALFLAAGRGATLSGQVFEADIRI